MKTRLQQNFMQRYQQWVKRRAPAVDEIVLEQRRIFIFPSKAALGFFTLMVLMLIAGINYQNNMIFVLCFWLLAVFVVVILQTFANVASLKVKLKPPAPVFAGELADIEIDCQATQRLAHRALEFSFKASELRQLEVYPQQGEKVYCDVLAQQKNKLNLSLLGAKRGRQELPPILLKSVYPLGLLNCWSWLRFAPQLLVYPRPLEPVFIPAAVDQHQGENLSQGVGDEEFLQARLYQVGDEIKHLDWFKLAKGQGLHTKQFGALTSEQLILDWNLFTGVETELRLSYLSFLARRYHHQQKAFGLSVPGHEIAIDTGEAHYQQVLTVLALFALPTTKSNAKAADKTSWRKAKRGVGVSHDS